MDEMMPDLSHLSEEERKIIEDVLQRQKAEEHKEQEIVEKADKELEDIEKLINERRDQAMRLIGTQDDAICQICQKTKFSDGIGHKCHYCQLRSCLRCGGKTPVKPKTSTDIKNGPHANKTVWACSLCQKRQKILGKTGKWTQLGSTHPPLQAPNQSMQDRALANSQRMNQNVAPAQPQQQQFRQQAPQNVQQGARPMGPQGPRPQGQMPPAERPGSQPRPRMPGPQQGQQPPGQMQGMGPRSQGMPPSQQFGPRPGQPQQQMPPQSRMPPPSMQQAVQPPQGMPLPGAMQQRVPLQNGMQNGQNVMQNQQNFPINQNAQGTQQMPQGFPQNQQQLPPNQMMPPNQQSGFLPNQQGPPQMQQPGFPPNQQGPMPNQQGPLPPNQQAQFLPNQQGQFSQNQQQGPLPPNQQPQQFPQNQQGPFPQNQQGQQFLPNQQGPFPSKQQDQFPPVQQGQINQQGQFQSNQVNQQGYVNQPGFNQPQLNSERIPPYQNGENMPYDSRQGRQFVPNNMAPQVQGPPNTYDVPSGDRRTPPPRGDFRPMPNGRLADTGPPPPMHGPRLPQPAVGSDYVCHNAPSAPRQPEDIYSSASTAKPPRPFRSEFESSQPTQPNPYASTISRPPETTVRSQYASNVPNLDDNRHQFGPVHDRDTRGEFPRDRSRDSALKAPEPPALLPSEPKLKKELGLSQLAQFESGRFPMAPRITRKDHEGADHRHPHKPKPIIHNKHHHDSNAHIVRVRKSRLSKQNRSLSSSDEEIASTSECPSCDDPEIESESFSEQDMLNKKNYAQLRNEDALSAKIKKFLSHPVTWQPSADGCTMIGHMVLHRHSAVPKGDLGFKVVGGRRTDTGRLAAFITRVRKESVADTVGRLKIGDEVLEWNGRTLQNLSFEQVYDIISESKHEPQVEIIVSRPRRSMSENFPPSHQQQPGPADVRLSTADLVQAMQGQQQPMVPMATSLPGLPTTFTQIPIDMQIPVMADYEGAPMLMVSGPDPMLTPIANPLASQIPYHPGIQPARGQIFGKIQLSIYFSPMDAQLVVTVHQAVDLPQRIDGSPRNPYVKVFLLPDRSERSQRRTKALAGTCTPNWQEPLVYNGILHADLMNRVLEVTVWDYDKYGTNEFLGEAVLDLAAAPLMNETQWHMLTDMDDDNPLRARVQKRRVSAYLEGKLQAESGYSPYAHGLLYIDPDRHDVMVSDQYSNLPQDMMPRSRTFHRSRMSGREEYYDQALNRSGYHSDGYPGVSPSPHNPHNKRRPRSAAGVRPGPQPGFLRPLSPTEGLDPMTLERNGGGNNRALPLAPSYAYTQQANRHRSGLRYQQNRNNRRQQPRVPFDPSSPSTDARAGGGGGYGSDENSETSISVTSTQSERPPRAPTHMIRIGQLPPQHSLDGRPDDMDMYEVEGMDAGTMSDSAVSRPATGNLNKAAAVMGLDPKRKRSMITRLMPGRANSANNVADTKKRLGFPRSEEVGVPQSTYLPGGTAMYSSPARPPKLLQQGSFESVGSSDSSWLPVVADGPLGDFVSDLGPGQVVGRQVLASPCLGEIQIGISDKRRSLEVEIIRARNLVAKPGAKMNPAPYVKVYLMEGKLCVAKAKTAATRRTTEPLFQTRLEFSEPHQGRMLQITVWGDYGRMERKGFMGIAQIQLDKLNLAQPVMGWFKLFHSNSLVAAGSSPSRKDSMPDVNTSPRSN